MLMLRDEQLAVLRRAAVDNFVRLLAARAREHFPALCAPHEKLPLRRMISAAIERAATFGIELPEDQAHFVHLVLAHGIDFDTLPDLAWTHPVLTSSTLSGTAKILLILQRLPERLSPGAPAAKER
jgi:hypothetical protein